MVLPIIWTLLNERFTLAVWMFVIAGASDALDGLLAKRFAWGSRLGGILDALADKLLLVSTFVCLWWLEVFPAWLVLAVLTRDIVIVVGSCLYNARIERFDPEPSKVSKLNTFLQIVLVALGVVHVGLTPISLELLNGLMYVVIVTVVLSGAGYVIEWTQRARKQKERVVHGQ